MTVPVMPVQTFQKDELSVNIHRDREDLARGAALEAQRQLARAIAARGAATMILAAANSQVSTLAALVRLGGVDWSRITLLHMDEYLGISKDHPASFRRFLRERVEDRVRPGVFHYIEGDCAQPLDECLRYADLLGRQEIDLCLLGIGENGHIAFNDPPVADFADPHRVKIVRLDEDCRKQQVGEGHFPNLDSVPQYAFTLTIPALCSAKAMLCIVPERRKATAVRNALTGPVESSCPASILRRQGHCRLYLDLESSSLL